MSATVRSPRYIGSFARELGARGGPRDRHRRLRTIAGFYKYTLEEELLEHSPAAHVRPRVDYESHAAPLDRTSTARCW
jgi:integrase/recombinase XerD